jgi:2-dehydropantoate 2-reductase
MLCIIPEVPQQEFDVPSLGVEEKIVRVNATNDSAELGPQDHIFVALKAHSISSVVDAMQPLICNRTSVVTAVNVVSYCYFHQHRGELAGTRLEMVDRGGKQRSGLGPERALGCVAHPATEVEPGVIQHIYGDKFPLSELSGEKAWFKAGWLLSDSGGLGRGHAT